MTSSTLPAMISRFFITALPSTGVGTPNPRQVKT
jgi:hypothetical protein